MLSVVFCVLFGLSLLPGRKPMCLRFAERISDGIMPDGAVSYCRRLTWIWFVVLLAGALATFGAGLYWAGPVLFVLTFAVEWPIRNRRFRVIFHTSGSTGKSKTIVKRFETLAREVVLHRRFYAAFDSSRLTFLGTVDTAHMLGRLWLDLLPDAMGAKADKSITPAPEELIAKMKAADQVFLVTTPSFLERFTAYADQYEVPRNCVEIVTSGAALSPEVSRRTKEVFGVEPRQIYGSTETGGIAWMRGEMRPKILEGVRCRAVPVEPGSEAMRLAVKSPFSFCRGWYLTGDGVELDADGQHLKLLGRVDRLVKINEQRVNLAEMEEKVRALGYRDAACIVLGGERGASLGLVLAMGGGVVLPEDGRVAGAELLELRRRFLDIFPKGTVPKRYRLVSELPRNTQGKVLKSEIEKMF